MKEIGAYAWHEIDHLPTTPDSGSTLRYTTVDGAQHRYVLPAHPFVLSMHDDSSPANPYQNMQFVSKLVIFRFFMVWPFLKQLKTFIKRQQQEMQSEMAGDFIIS